MLLLFLNDNGKVTISTCFNSEAKIFSWYRFHFVDLIRVAIKPDEAIDDCRSNPAN